MGEDDLPGDIGVVEPDGGAGRPIRRSSSRARGGTTLAASSRFPPKSPLAPRARPLTQFSATRDQGRTYPALAGTPNGKKKKSISMLARVDDPTDLEYVRQGGILQQVLRERLAAN
jgi:hypothetical protein